MDQSSAPYFEALVKYVEQENATFHIPGHQHGLSLPAEMAALLQEWGARADITEVLGIDDIHAPVEQVHQAQQLAAEAYGADHTFFLVNGSTVGNQAMFLSQLGPEDTVLMPQASHRSAYAALLLSGAKAHCFVTEFHHQLLCCLPPTVEEVESALRACPDAKALFLTSPIYHGAGADMAALARLAQERELLLMVDEAWGAHLRFCSRLPPSSVGLADMVVQSAHKMTGALGQSALLHTSGSRVDRGRLQSVLRHLQTSSPSSLLVASIDCARRQMARVGQELWERTLELASETRTAVNQLPDISCFKSPSNWDGSRLLISAVGRGYSGHQLNAYLRECGIQVEMSEPHQILVLLTPGHTEKAAIALLDALRKLPKKAESVNFSALRRVLQELHSQLASPCLDLRRAFQARSTSVDLKKAVDRSSAELLYCYPPGVPFVVPGQRFTQEMLELMNVQRRLGGSIQGGADPTLQTVLVLEDSHDDK